MIDVDAVLWRVFRTTGPHTSPWNALRTFGPISTCRFDPHPDGPPRHHPGVRVMYTAASLPTAVAEVFQTTRVVDGRHGAPAAVAFRLNRPVQLLDLSGGWPLRAGAAHVINTGRRAAARSWASAIT